jgi:alpha-galactosidase
MIKANEQNQIMHIDRYLEEGFKLDYWWMDAGWYIQQQGWPQVGTWEVDPRDSRAGFGRSAITLTRGASRSWSGSSRNA